MKRIEEEFMELLRDLRKKIEALEREKADLLAEIEGLKKVAQDRASKLEMEVTTLRKEVKALEKLLNVKEKTQNEEIQNEGSS